MITIQQKNDLTEVNVYQHGVPVGEEENTFEAWKRIYWKNIGATFDYNARLMYVVRNLYFILIMALDSIVVILCCAFYY